MSLPLPPYLAKWHCSPKSDALFGAGLVDAMIKVELAYLEAMAKTGLLKSMVVQAIREKLADFAPNHAELAKATQRDGVPVPGLVLQMRARLDEHQAAILHKGMTSQDVVDSALMLAIKSVNSEFRAQSGRLEGALQGLTKKYGECPIFAYTRMQKALEIPASQRIESWAAPLGTHIARLEALEPRLLRLSLGGAVGDGRDWGEKRDKLSEAMAKRLALHPGPSWHNDRGNIVAYASWLASLTGHLGKIGMDIALMARDGEITLKTGGASSSMAHKSNPIGAEALICFARLSAGLLGTIAQAMPHEMERSGAAWGLEWLTLPPMIATLEAALNSATGLIGDIKAIGSLTK